MDVAAIQRLHLQEHAWTHPECETCVLLEAIMNLQAHCRLVTLQRDTAKGELEWLKRQA